MSGHVNHQKQIQTSIREHADNDYRQQSGAELLCKIYFQLLKYEEITQNCPLNKCALQALGQGGLPYKMFHICSEPQAKTAGSVCRKRGMAAIPVWFSSYFSCIQRRTELLICGQHKISGNKEK